MQVNFLTAVLVTMAMTGNAMAQSAPPSSNAAASAVANGTYRSAMEGYRRHADPPLLSWRDANDSVGRIGGWQAYAREAAGETPSSASDQLPESRALTGAPAPKASASAGRSAVHGGHGRGSGR